MSFLVFVVRRLALVVPTLVGVSVIGFLLAYLLPGNPALVKAGPIATPQYVAEMKHKMGLDQPVYVQYARYATGLLHGDLGESSSTGRPVLTDFMQRLPATLELTVASLLLAILLGVPVGVLCAIHRDTLIDHLGRVFGVAGVAMPSFWTGLILIYVFFYLLDIAPAPLGRLGPGINPPVAITGLYTVDSLISGNWPRVGIEPRAPRVAVADPRHQRDGTARTVGTGGDAGNFGDRLHQGRMGIRPAALAYHIQRCAR